MENNITAKDISKLEINRGDIVVLKLDDMLSRKELASIDKRMSILFKNNLGYVPGIIALSPDLDIGTLGQPELIDMKNKIDKLIKKSASQKL